MVETLYEKDDYLMIGNTRWHWASEFKEKLKYFHTSPNPKEFRNKDYSNLIWSSVGTIPKNINLCASNKISLKDIPLINLPNYLGIDRALASWSAFQKQSNLLIKSQDIIVIDAGTILSVTKITKKGEFAGGQLISGFTLQLSSMVNGAKNLETPVSTKIPKETFQYETSNSMIRGAINGLVGLILKILEEEKSPIWLCGGDAPLILNELKNKNIEIYHYPNLVLEGMIDIHKKSYQF